MEVTGLVLESSGIDRRESPEAWSAASVRIPGYHQDIVQVQKLLRAAAAQMIRMLRYTHETSKSISSPYRKLKHLE